MKLHHNVDTDPGSNYAIINVFDIWEGQEVLGETDFGACFYLPHPLQAWSVLEGSGDGVRVFLQVLQTAMLVEENMGLCIPAVNRMRVRARML